MEPPEIVIAFLASASLAALLIPWLRSHRYEALRRRRHLPAVNRSLVLLYLILTFVAVDLAWWAIYHATFGRVNPSGPSDPMLLLSGLAAFVIAAGGLLLPVYRLTAAVMAFAGLTVAIAAFASGIRPTDVTSTQTWLFDLVGIGLALVGMVLVARSART